MPLQSCELNYYSSLSPKKPTKLVRLMHRPLPEGYSIYPSKIAEKALLKNAHSLNSSLANSRTKDFLPKKTFDK